MLEVKDQATALAVAIEMETQAVKVYERALMLAETPEMTAGLQGILTQERGHLRKFREMQEGNPALTPAARITLQEQARNMLFPGGLMAVMSDVDAKDPASLWEFAANSEDTAIQRYTQYAQRCQDPAARDAFLAIANEEKDHLRAFTDELKRRRGE